jgi:C-terminal processing protease CtpA/Prc
MDDGSALFLTVANYFNANGKPILEDGVEPTEVVRAAADSDDDGDDDSSSTPSTTKSKEYGPRPLSPEDQIYRKALDLLKNPGAAKKAA